MSAAINAASFLMLSIFGIAAVGYLLGRITTESRESDHEQPPAQDAEDRDG